MLLITIRWVKVKSIYKAKWSIRQALSSSLRSMMKYWPLQKRREDWALAFSDLIYGIVWVTGVSCKGLAKLGNIVAETLLRAQMFSSLAAQATLLRMQILRPRRKKMFLN